MIKLLNLPANTAFDFDHSFEEHLIKIGYRDLNAEDLVLEFECSVSDRSQSDGTGQRLSVQGVPEV